MDQSFEEINVPVPNHPEEERPLPLDQGRKLEMELRTTILEEYTQDWDWSEDELRAGKLLFTNQDTSKLVFYAHKVKTGQRTDREEETLWDTHKGFYYEKIADRIRRREACDYTLTEQIGKEKDSLQGYGADRIRTGDEGGPRITELLHQDKGWKREMNSVIIGMVVLLFIPFVNLRRTINMGIFDILSYQTPDHEGAAPIPHEENFIEFILSKLQLIGKNMSIPIYIEFFPSPDRSSEHWHHQICGFMYHIVRLQQYYHGPIIVIYPPYVPQGFMTEIDYNECKIKNARMARMMLLYGHALGVPVLDMFVQNRPHSPTHFFIRQNFFQNLPLFARGGKSTEEFDRRMSICYERFHYQMLQGVLTKEERERSREAEI